MTGDIPEQLTAPWIIDPPTGWPAPFDLVQGFFESSWDSIINGIDSLWQNIVAAFTDLWNNIVAAVDNLWTNIVAAFSDLYASLSDFVSSTVDWLYNRIIEIVGYWDPDRKRFVGGFLGWLWDAIAGALDYLWSLFSGFGDWLTDCFTWLSDTISGWISGAVDTLSTALGDTVSAVSDALLGFSQWIADSFDWLHSEIVGWLTGAMEAVAGAIGDGLQTLWTWLTETLPGWFTSAAGFLNETVVQPILGGLQWVFDRVADTLSSIVDGIISLFEGHSPITGEEALRVGILAAVTAAISGGVLTSVVDIASTKALGSGLELRSLGRFMVELINPSMFMGAVLGVLVTTGVRMPLSHYYNKFFRPAIPSVRDAQEMLWRGKLTEDQFRDVLAMSGYRDIYEEGYVELTHRIPPAPDLITMVVREAFIPEMVIEAPKIFADYLTLSGYSKEWADRYWTAHFVPIELRQAYENLWRGLWDKERFFRALTIADIHPMWHEDIYNVAFRPPSIREMGYGYDTGLYSVDDIIKYRRWGGLSPEDAEKAGQAMVAYRTEAEREALRREAIYDFTDGLDSEETLRAKLEAIGGRPEIIELWVSRAKYRYERDVKRDLIKTVKNQAVKGLITIDQLREDLEAIGVVPERIEVHVAEVETRRARYVREEESEKKRKLTEAKLAKAWELGLIGDDGYVSGLVERGYTEEDAKLMLDILRTPKPITPEEIERRKASITARINRTKRRYELMISRLDAQIGLISDEITASEATQKEVLDVYDTELDYLTKELAVAPPEKVPTLEKRIALIRERRDVAVARHAERLTKLKDNLAAAADRKQELLKLRDEEISELESELESLGVAG